ncbi:hypothetical protein F4779DRAFT_637978 [Xylariaceae sp. FL0662B]|nr:hypothetical protein F4779DRAFT_637978 [Xylariaceae sp. FL0662B]
MQPLTTVFSPPSWCSNRYAVFIDTRTSASSTLQPSSGWIDPSFTKCIPTQYKTTYQVFSPGVCPEHMSMVTSTSKAHGGRTIWTGGCCQSGFSTMDIDPHWFCTSAVTTPMAFLLDPNISTADIYTTLSSSSGLWIEHDQMTIQWEETDLRIFPMQIASHYASIMGVAFTGAPVETTASTTSSAATSSASVPGTNSNPTVPPSATPPPVPSAVTVATITSLVVSPVPHSSSRTSSSSTSSSAGVKRRWSFKASSVACLVFLWLLV